MDFSKLPKEVNPFGLKRIIMNNNSNEPKRVGLFWTNLKGHVLSKETEKLLNIPCKFRGVVGYWFFGDSEKASTHLFHGNMKDVLTCFGRNTGLYYREIGSGQIITITDCYKISEGEVCITVGNMAYTVMNRNRSDEWHLTETSLDRDKGFRKIETLSKYIIDNKAGEVNKLTIKPPAVDIKSLIPNWLAEDGYEEYDIADHMEGLNVEKVEYYKITYNNGAYDLVDFKNGELTHIANSVQLKANE